MKYLISLFTTALISMLSFAQTQQGYVKTKGRLGNNGSVIAGQRLSGATVTVKGSNAVVSGSNGTFALSIPGNSYYLQNVQKQGYVLTDPDILSKQYACSKNPLVLVLETPGQQTDDKLAAEKKIRRTLQRQLQEKEDELESLKEQNKLSEEAYRQQLQELYAQQENNDNLISEMADRYSRMDFDEVDEFNRCISSLILEGKLTEADSLLNTKGDINSRAAQLREHQKTNTIEEQKLRKQQKGLEKKMQLTQKELEDIANDCYSKFKIAQMRNQNDSAAYYIELRANLDTTNIEWGINAGKFYQKYKASYDKAEFFFLRCLRNALTAGGDNSLLPDCYEALGSVYLSKGNMESALDYYKKDYEISLSIFGEYHQSIVSSLINLTNVNRRKGDFETALNYLEKALEVMNATEGLSVASKIKVYGNIANLYNSQNQHQRALEYYQKAIEILESSKESHPLEESTTYINIGHTCFEMGEYDLALEWDNKAYELVKKVLGDSHPAMATILSNMGGVYMKQNRLDKTLENIKKSLSIDINIYGQYSPNLIIDYNNLGMVQYSMKLNQEALESYKCSLDLCEKHLPHDHPIYATIYNNIGSALLRMDGEEEKAMSYFENALKIRLTKYGENNSDVAIVYYNMAKLYQKKEDIENALLYFEKAKEIFESTLGHNHPNTKSVQESIAKIKE